MAEIQLDPGCGHGAGCDCKARLLKFFHDMENEIGVEATPFEDSWFGITNDETLGLLEVGSPSGEKTAGLAIVVGLVVLIVGSMSVCAGATLALIIQTTLMFGLMTAVARAQRAMILHIRGRLVLEIVRALPPGDRDAFFQIVPEELDDASFGGAAVRAEDSEP